MKTQSVARGMRGGMMGVMLGAAMMLTGCLFFDGPGQDGSGCDVTRRCAQDTTPVCGEDGETYACASMARCEGAVIDLTGESCDEPVPHCPEHEGFALECDDADGDGQMECDCVKVGCPELLCDVYCEYGHQQDANGCDTCACVERPVCSTALPACGDGEQAVCDTSDPQGCPVCTCEPVGCPELLCDVYCEYGHQQDANGCDTCACNPGPTCVPEACPSNTRSVCTPDADGDGCDECICEPVACPPIAPPECPDEEGVSLECSDQDGDGCAECACVKVSCPDYECAMYCEEGYAIDENGCQTCECRSMACDDIPLCDIFCEYGNKRDQNGCELCACNEPPRACDADSNCPPGFVCAEQVSEMCCPSGSFCMGTLPACETVCLELP